MFDRYYFKTIIGQDHFIIDDAKPRYKNNCSKKVNELHHVTNGLKLFDFTL